MSRPVAFSMLSSSTDRFPAERSPHRHPFPGPLIGRSAMALTSVPLAIPN